jgi:hypothetical protein
MSDFQFDYTHQILPLDEASKKWRPPEYQYSMQTLGRYASEGLDGVKLPTMRVGNKLCTTQTALEWFFGQVKPAKRAYTNNGQSAETNGQGRVTVYANTSPELIEFASVIARELGGIKEAIGLLLVAVEDLKRAPRVPAEANGALHS